MSAPDASAKSDLDAAADRWVRLTARRALRGAGGACAGSLLRAGGNELGILLVLVLLVARGRPLPAQLPLDRHPSAISCARAAWFGIIALGIVFLLSMGEIDLSTASIYALTINLAAILIVSYGDQSVGRGSCPASWSARFWAFVNGVHWGPCWASPIIIITLGTLSAFRGPDAHHLGRWLYLRPPARAQPSSPSLGSAPLRGARWSYGSSRRLTIVLIDRLHAHALRLHGPRAIGSNPKAAELSGIPINARPHRDPDADRRALRRIGDADAGVLLDRGPEPQAPGFELLAITAAIVGGTALDRRTRHRRLGRPWARW